MVQADITHQYVLVKKSRDAKIEDIEAKCEELKKEKDKIDKKMKEKNAVHRKEMDERLKVLEENKKIMTEICERFSKLLKEQKGEVPVEKAQLDKEMEEFRNLMTKLDTTENLNLETEKIKELDIGNKV